MGKKVLIGCAVIGALLLIIGGGVGGYLLLQTWGTAPIAPVSQSGAGLAPPTHSLPKADPAGASKPLDPWSVPAIPIRAWIAVMPFSDDLVYTDRGGAIQLAIQSQWALHLPRDIGLVNGNNIRGLIWRTCVRTRDGFDVETSVTVSQVWSVFQPDYLVSGSVRTEGEEMVVQVSMKMRDKTETTYVRVAKDADLLVAPQVCEWMNRVGGMNIPAATLAGLSRPRYGTIATSYRTEPLLSMGKNPHHPLWEKFPATDHVVRLERASAAAKANDAKMVEKLNLPPLESDAPLIDHMLREACLDFLGQRGAALHEQRLTMAKWPGYLSKPRAWIFTTFGGGEKREQYLETIEQWYRRAGDLPYVQALLGSAYKTSAWDWRGTSYYNQIPVSHREKFHTLSARAQSVLVDAIRKGFDDPWITSEVIGLYGQESGPDNQRKMMDLFEYVAARYPNATDPWYSVTNYLRPRWGGSHEQAFPIIQRAVDEHPNNPEFGWIPMSYHFSEAGMEIGISNEIECFKQYCKRYPSAREHVLKGFELLLLPNASKQQTVYAMNVAQVFDDIEMKDRVVRNRHDFHTHVKEGVLHKWYPYVMYSVAWRYFDNGYYKEMREISQLCETNDKVLRRRQPIDTSELVFDDEGDAETYHALGQALGGDPERGLARLQARVEKSPETALFLCFAKHILKRPIDDADLAPVEKMLEQGKELNSVYPMLAIAYHSKGRNDESLKMQAKYEELRKKTPRPMLLCFEREMRTLFESE